MKQTPQASAKRERTRVPLPHLRAWRLARLLSQDEVADMTGIAKSTLSKLENEQSAANLVTVGKLAKALGLTRQQLAYTEPSRAEEDTSQPNT